MSALLTEIREAEAAGKATDPITLEESLKMPYL
jgi:hypothetical protein